MSALQIFFLLMTFNFHGSFDFVKSEHFLSEWKKDTVTLIDAGCWPPYFVASSESDNTFPTGCNVMLVKPCTKMQHIGIFKAIVQQNMDSLVRCCVYMESPSCYCRLSIAVDVRNDVVENV